MWSCLREAYIRTKIKYVICSIRAPSSGCAAYLSTSPSLLMRCGNQISESLISTVPLSFCDAEITDSTRPLLLPALPSADWGLLLWYDSYGCHELVLNKTFITGQQHQEEETQPVGRSADLASTSSTSAQWEIDYVHHGSSQICCAITASGTARIARVSMGSMGSTLWNSLTGSDHLR